MATSKVSRRECFFIKVSDRKVDYLMEKIKSAISEIALPPRCKIGVYRDVYSCCGGGYKSLVIEVTGSSEEEIKEVDLKAMAKLIEICEKENIEFHALMPFEII